MIEKLKKKNALKVPYPIKCNIKKKFSFDTIKQP